MACHNYNTITVGLQEINVATIDTMLTFYLAFYYVDKTYYNRDRIICMAQFLFELEEKLDIIVDNDKLHDASYDVEILQKCFTNLNKVLN